MWDSLAILCVVVAVFFLVRRYINNASCSCGCRGCKKGEDGQQNCASLHDTVDKKE